MNRIQQAPRPARIAVARALTEVFSPVVLVIGLLLGVGVESSRNLVTGLAWGGVAALFVGVVPYTFLLLGIRRGRWTGRHVPVREQRIVPLTFAAVSVIVGIGVLVIGGAPRQVVALVIAGLVGLGVAIAITRHWKMSIHTAVAAGTTTILVLVFGSWLNFAWLAVAGIGWSRLELRDHSVAQVVAGAVLGCLVAGGVFSVLR